MICTSIAESDFETCLAMIRESEMAEVRLDAASFSLEQVARIFTSHDHLIATCRAGRYNDKQRMEQLKQAMQSGANYVDIEVDADNDYINDMLQWAIDFGVKKIISYHNFKKTPSLQELKSIGALCNNLGADVIKVACKVNAMQDNANILALYLDYPNLIAIGMGDLGKITRLVSLYLGAGFTFASLSVEKNTAPGQLTITELQNIQEILNKI